MSHEGVGARLAKTDPIGLIGAGAMGLPVARHLLHAGFRIATYDTDPERVDAARRLGSDAAERISNLEHCRAVLVFVPKDSDVVAVAAEFASVARADSFFLIHSSVQPRTCQIVGDELGRRSVRVLDAPLTGGVRAAEAGTVRLLVGGSADDLQACEEVLIAWTSSIHHLGGLGSGQVGKTVNNLIHWGEIVTIVEALRLGDALGVPAARMRGALFDGPTDGRTLRELLDMRLTWFDKDIDNARAMARDVGLELELAPVVQRLMKSITVPAIASLLAARDETTGPVSGS